MSIFTAILLGLINGITVFMPVSYSGHMVILKDIFGLQYVESENMLFEAMLHIGTLLAIVFAYKKELKGVVGETALALLGRNEEAEGGRFTANVRTAFFVLAASVPMLVYLPFKDQVMSLGANLPFVAFTMIVSGTIVFAAGKLAEGRKNERTSTLADAVMVGVAQTIACVPGVSVPGATISVGLARGFRKSFAVKFSFFLAVPVMLVSAFADIFVAIGNEINWGAFPSYIVGMLITVFVGYYSIMILRNLLKRGSFGKISRYCWGAGIVILVATLFV